MSGRLNIQTGLRGNTTFLANSFCTQPFKIANITEDKSSNFLRLMLMSSSPGILDGDHYHLQINVIAKTSLQLETQSYQRLYNMKSSASQKMDVCVEKDAAFYFLPHPVVPHKLSSFSAINTIHLSETSSLLWGEVITCGRNGSGESFLFSKLHNLTRIFVNKKLIMQENVLIEPLKINVHAIGQLEGYTHQATLIFLDQKIEVKKMISEISAFLNEIGGIESGITAAPRNGIILRLLGYKAEKLFEILKEITKQFCMPSPENIMLHQTF